MKQLIKYPDPFLYNVSIPVDDPSKYFDTCVQMIKECNLLNGYALAAKQVGMLESFFVVKKSNSLPSDCPEMIFNPSIVNPVGQIFYKESCLSLPKITAKNKRFQELTLKYKDIENKDQEYHCKGLFAIVVQHEIDHLNGKLFIDSLSSFEKDKVIHLINKLRK
jgi:peptide deformylase